MSLMESVLFGIGVAGLVGVLLSLVILRRNDAVDAYRSRVLDEIFELHGTERDARLEVFKGVSYDSMVWRFWRPLDSFFPAAPSTVALAGRPADPVVPKAQRARGGAEGGRG